MITRLWLRLVRFGFRLLYNEFAFTYDVVSKVVSLGAWRCWQRAALRHLNAAGRVLELAHGTGDLQLDLAARQVNAIGYDLSPAMGRIASRKLRRHAVTVRLARGRAQTLPFPDGCFSSVVSTFPSEFIVAPETVREVYRVLAPGGRFVIVPGAEFTGGGLARAALEWLYRITGQRRAEVAPDDSGLRHWLTPYGFDATVEREPCPNSVALVVVATKTERISPDKP